MPIIIIIIIMIISTGSPGNCIVVGQVCLSPGAISPLVHTILLPDVRFPCLNKDSISLRDKRLFEITRVDCSFDCITQSPRS